MARRAPTFALLLAHVHGALGSLVATNCDLSVLGSAGEVHGAFSLGLVGGAAALRSTTWIRWLGPPLLCGGLTIAALQSSSVLATFALAALCELLTIGGRASPRWRGAGFALVYGVLSFAAGYLACAPRPGPSCALLAVGFAGIYASAQPLLDGRPGASWRPWRRPLDRSTALSWFGLPFLFAWIFLYGPGWTGTALAAPGALWLSWLTITATFRGRSDEAPAVAPGHCALAWLSLEAGVGLSSYL